MAGGTDDDELLRGFTGQARRERAELIQWLRAQGFDDEQIRGALVPMLLPANRVVGEDGTTKPPACLVWTIPARRSSRVRMPNPCCAVRLSSTSVSTRTKWSRL